MSVSEEIMLKVENVSKIYKLGEIGGTTLRDELQRLHAKIHKKEDPTKKIGAKNYNKGEKFKALDNISFEVKKGERIGIIGHNGAGKSTLLKLISRVTGPTEGNIYLNGRVASMLEVGTGFHPELTGRENIYMNGAILGMTKKEIDAKMEDIIEFSEVRQFIDTPVKRYSSGMYVKLAFSVAAHLNSEIVIMDEVLAVGDVAFQNKCIQKMKSISEQEGKTILYVSHNMNTIRQLCDKVIVLNSGKIVFDGNVNKGILTYLNKDKQSFNYSIDTSNISRPTGVKQKISIKKIVFLKEDNNTYNRGEKVGLKIIWKNVNSYNSLRFRITVRNESESFVGTTVSKEIFVEKNPELEQTSILYFDTALLSEAKYYLSICAFLTNERKSASFLDFLGRVCNIEVIENDIFDDYIDNWEDNCWGNVHLPELLVK